MTVTIDKSNGKEEEASSAITVKPAISLDITSLDFVVGEEGGRGFWTGSNKGPTYIPLKVTVLDPNAKDKSIFWESSNSAIATVNSTGYVYLTTTVAGTVTITAKVDNLSASCKITVYALPSGNNGITINGVTWATRNVDNPGTFVVNPTDEGKKYQWNRNVAHFTGITDNTMPEGSSWTKANDPSPSGWRVPTLDEIKSLLDKSVPHRWTLINGVYCILWGAEPNVIVLPHSKLASYWSSTSFSSIDANALWIHDISNFPGAFEITNYDRTFWCLVRSVKE